MANTNERPDNPANTDDGWVEKRLDALEPPRNYEADSIRARARLRERQSTPPPQGRMWIAFAVAGCLALVALPWPRALAQELWNRLRLDRVAVVQVDDETVPEHVTAMFIMEPGEFDQTPAATIAEAERMAGFRPLLPPPDVLKGTPGLAVVKTVALASKPLNTRDMQRALAAAGVTDVTVPTEWDGLTLTAEAGPVVVAAYENVEIMQATAFQMNTPPGFQFGRFMEIAFRVFGRNADEARMLGAKFEANPALLVHFPERAPVRDLPLRSGRGIIVGDLNGDDPICFFWNAPDRIFIVTASHVSERTLVALADSVR